MNKSTIFTIIGGTLLVLLLTSRLFLYEMFKIPSGAMIPTLQVGDHIGVNKNVYWWHEPSRGEIMVFKYPKQPDKDFIKRIVAVGGDTIEIRDNQLILNGQPVPRRHLDGDCSNMDFDELTGRWEQARCDAWEEKLGDHVYTVIQDPGREAQPFAPRTVPPGHFFVLGDNRDNSHDSRYWGFVPRENVKGRAEFVAYSFGPDGMRKGRSFTKIR